MKKQTLHRKSTNVIAFVGVLTLIGTLSANAAFTPLAINTPMNTPGSLDPISTGATDGLVGTVLAVRNQGFSDVGTPPPFDTGVLRSFVVDRSGGMLDFYYQVVATSTPASELSRLRSLLGFDQSLTIEVGQFDGSTLAGLMPGTSGFDASSYDISAVGRQSAATADRDQGGIGPGSVGFDFSQNIFDTNNIQGGEHSSFLVIRTNSKQFGNIDAELTGTGGFSFASTFGAVPEPSSVIFGFGVLGVCLRGRRSRRA